jgi:hypothetical protein
VSLPDASLPPSRSASRLVGDDVQHLIVWYWWLRACAPNSDIVSVELEIDGAGNLDDLRVTFSDGRQIYWQIKATVSAEHLANIEWLTKKAPSGSLIQRLHKSWAAVGRPADGIALITSRLIDSNDPLLRHLNRLNRLGERVRRATAADAREARASLAAHLGCSEEELYEFLDVLELHVGATEGHWRDRIDDAAIAAGVQPGDATRAIGVAEVREWAKTTRSPRTQVELRTRVRELGIASEAPRTVLLVEALDEVSDASDEDIRLHWVHHFRGESEFTRRGVVVRSLWNNQMTQ